MSSLEAITPLGPLPPLEEEPVVWRTLADIDDTPPPPLVLGMIENGPNLLYAAGGTGKGSTGSWIIQEYEKLGKKVLIYDPEGRPHEWARRTSALGVDRSRVPYIGSSDLPATLMGKQIWDLTEFLARAIKETQADLLMVDSVLASLRQASEEALKSDPGVPYRYVAALDSLGIPSVSFGHTPRNNPDGEPFGSMGWVAAMRLTWHGKKAEKDGHAVRWRPRKRNERGHIPGVLLEFQYEDDRLVDVIRSDDDETTRDWILGALVAGICTTARMAEALAEESGEEVTDEDLKRIKARLGTTLWRMKKQGWVETVEINGREHRWVLKTRTGGPVDAQ